LLNEEKLFLQNQETLNENLKALLQRKESELECLEKEKNSLRREIEVVQSRLSQLTEEGVSLLQDEESLIRQKESLVRSQKMMTFKSEARVSALREIVAEKRKELDQISRKELFEQERKEHDSFSHALREFKYNSVSSPSSLLSDKNNIASRIHDSKSDIQNSSSYADNIDLPSSLMSIYDDDSSEEENKLIKIRNSAKLSLQKLNKKVSDI